VSLLVIVTNNRQREGKTQYRLSVKSLSAHYRLKLMAH